MNLKSCFDGHDSVNDCLRPPGDKTMVTRLDYHGATAMGHDDSTKPTDAMIESLDCPFRQDTLPAGGSASC